MTSDEDDERRARIEAARAAVLKGPLIISVSCSRSGPGTYTRYIYRLGERDPLRIETLRDAPGADPVETGKWTIEGERAQRIYDKLTR